MKRAAAASWPTVLVPEPGCYPPSLEGYSSCERVLHLSLYPGRVGDLGLRRACESYEMVYWRGRGQDEVVADAIATAKLMRPTVVFMQLQVAGVIEPEHVAAIRAHCSPTCVVINFDGDQHHEPAAPEREWFVRLGQACDASLVCNTEHPHDYARLGVCHPGYLQIAVDPAIFSPAAPAKDVPPVVILANGGHPSHRIRSTFLSLLADEMGKRCLGVYGSGWDPGRLSARPALDIYDEAPVYAAAKAALSISARGDLPRYTSDRLFRLLACAGVPVVEAFPDSDGLGLVGGWNCLLWRGYTDLRRCITTALRMDDDERSAMRAAALALSRDHVWAARIPELMAIVEAVRADRSFEVHAGCA